MSNQEDILRVLRKSRQDPVYFCRNVLGFEPWPIQEEILLSLRDNPRTAVPSCHASGKSAIAGRAALWFLMCHPNSIVFTSAPTWLQVKNILWKEITVAYRSAKVKLPGEIYKNARLEVSPGWFAFGFATDNSDSFQGIHADYVLGVFDEATGIENPIWEALEGNLSGGKIVRFLSIANPTSVSSPFFAECRDPRTKVIPISVYQTPNFTKFGITEQDVSVGTQDEWEAVLREKVTESYPYPNLANPEFARGLFLKHGLTGAEYESRVCGRFPQQGSDSLVWLSWAQDAKKEGQEFMADIPQGWEMEVKNVDVGVDVARFGDDESVISVVVEGHQIDQRVSGFDDTVQTAGKVLNCSKELHERFPNADVWLKIDEPGVGGGVIDILKNECRPVRGVDRYPWLHIVPANTGRGARDSEGFYLRRAEWWWGVRDRFESHDITIVDDPVLINQLTGIKYTYTPRGQIKVEEKSEAKKRGIKSPDRADALMLALAPVKKRAGAKMMTSRLARKPERKSYMRMI